MHTQIIDLVKKYQRLISQPSEALFDEVFSCSHPCSLIAVSKCFETREHIYSDFILGGLQKAYSRIALISDDITVRPISEELAIVVFQYHTDCDLRETGEPFGISGLETQVVIKENGQWRIVHIHYSKA